MSASRAGAIIAAVVVVIALALWLPRGNRADHSLAERATTEAAEHVRSSATGPQSDAKHATPPDRDLIARDPDAAARLWRAHAKDVLFAKNRKEYGDEVARLLELPYDEAWGPLVEKSKDDARAALAANFIQSICRAEATRDDSRMRERPASSFYKGLPDAMKPFIDRIAEQHTQEHEQRVAHCAGIATGTDVAMAALDAYMRPENVDAQIQVAGENADRREAISDLRAIVSKQDTNQGLFALGDLLMESEDASERAEGRATLELLARNNVDVANRLAYCLQSGCGGSNPDPAAALPWLETSAGLGDLLGFANLENTLAENGDRASAWAWSLYALDLALDGCFETFYPSHRYVAMAAQQEAQQKTGLTPAEQNAGLATSYAIEGRWAKRAKERLSCD